jgi:hypothetical protein
MIVDFVNILLGLALGIILVNAFFSFRAICKRNAYRSVYKDLDK